MTERELFNKLISKDPTPGKPNRLKSKRGVYFLPRWIFDNETDYKDKIRAKKGILLISKTDVPLQILYDILHLGLKTIDERPKCKICGKPVTFINGYKGYKKLCNNPICKKESGRITALTSWSDNDYRIIQTKSHKVWAAIPENTEYLKNKMLNLWKNEDYRKLQSNSHKLFAKNNPDKVFSGNIGTIESKKSIGGTIRFDSNWEKDVILYCNKDNEIIHINRSNLSIPYIYEDEEFIYVPDFIISTKSGNFLVEVKSDFLLKSDPKTKFKIDAGYRYVDDHKDVYKKYIVLFSADIYSDNNFKIFNETNFKTLLDII